MLIGVHTCPTFTISHMRPIFFHLTYILNVCLSLSIFLCPHWFLSVFWFCAWFVRKIYWAQHLRNLKKRKGLQKRQCSTCHPGDFLLLSIHFTCFTFQDETPQKLWPPKKKYIPFDPSKKSTTFFQFRNSPSHLNEVLSTAENWQNANFASPKLHEMWWWEMGAREKLFHPQAAKKKVGA